MSTPHQEVRQAIAGEVRAAAARQSISGNALAEMVGTTGPHMHRRLKGQVPFTGEELVAVASALGVTPASLMPHTR